MHLVGRTALHLAHQIGDGELGRHRDEHVDMVARQYPAQDVDLVLATHLTADVAHPQTQRPGQHLVAVLRRPDDAPLVTLLRNALPVKG